jgi:SAM-dependent methyltransferase
MKSMIFNSKNTRNMNEPRGQELVERYRENYGICKEAAITEEMVLFHWELEQSLTQEILISKPESRWETVERCYTKLYKELEWLNRLIDSNVDTKNLDAKYADWIRWIGPNHQKVYEVGSGRGELITYLAERGYECRATEITKERGKKWVDSIPNLSWSISDGVHLEHFEPASTYDVVISDQVVEHLHPDDLVRHFEGVLEILVSGGRYIFRTPHVHDGPWDISRVFKCDKSRGMHLKEYTYRELAMKLKQAGFKRIQAAAPLFSNKKQILRNFNQANAFHAIYLNYLYMVEELIGVLPNQEIKRKALCKASHLFKFLPHITMIAEKN